MKGYDLLQAEYLGTYVKEKYPGESVCVIVSKEGEEPVPQDQLDFIQAFEKGLGSSVTVREFPITPASRPRTEADKLPPSEDGTTNATPTGSINQRHLYMKSVSAAAYDRFFQKTQEKVLINLAGMPKGEFELENLKFLKQKSKKVLILPYCTKNPGMSWEIADGVRKGSVGAVVILNRKKKLETDVPEDLKEAFDARFILISSENIRELSDDPDYRLLLNEPTDDEDAELEE